MSSSTNLKVPKGWREITLGNLGKFSTSSVDKKVSSSETPVRLVNYMDVYRNDFINDSLELMEVTATRYEIERSQVKMGNLLFTPSSETPDDICHCSVVTEELSNTLHSYHTVRLELSTDSEIDIRFSGRLGYIASVAAHLQRRATGSTRYTLTLGDFEETRLVLPPIQEQRIIGKILDDLDDAMNASHDAINKLKDMKLGLIQDLITPNLEGNGLRNSLQYFQDEVQILPLREVAELLDSRRIPINSDERFNRQGEIPYYGANGQQGWIDTPIFSEPLILLAEDGGNFDDFSTRPIAYRIDGPAWVNNHAHVVRARDGYCQDFLFWSLVHKDIRKYIAGGTRSKLTQGEMLDITINVPSYSRQQKIAEILNNLEERLEDENNNFNNLSLIKKGLMDDLLSGKVRIPESMEVCA
jgi:restriction endonuclease S subunit